MAIKALRGVPADQHQHGGDEDVVLDVNGTVWASSFSTGLTPAHFSAPNHTKTAARASRSAVAAYRVDLDGGVADGGAGQARRGASGAGVVPAGSVSGARG